MSSYLNGYSDRLGLIDFEPNLQLASNVMQLKQERYNQGFQQVKSLYSSALNSSLTRETNQQRRDEFFKKAESQVRDIAKLDLSRSANVASAANVFKPLIEDQRIIKDMAWTANYQSQLALANELRQSGDSGYWDEGVQYMQMKAKEFSESTDDEAFSFGNVEYAKRVDLTTVATKYANDMGYEVKLDTPSGKYLITDTNGRLLAEPLQKLFMKKFATDGSVQNMYRVKAAVSRTNFVSNYLANGYDSEEEAENAYLSNVLSLAGQKVTEEDIEIQRSKKYNKSLKSLVLSQKGTSKERLDDYLEQLNNQDAVLNSLEEDNIQNKNNIRASRNSDQRMQALRDRSDYAQSTILIGTELAQIATYYSQAKQERTLKKNPAFGTIRSSSSNNNNTTNNNNAPKPATVLTKNNAISAEGRVAANETQVGVNNTKLSELKENINNIKENSRGDMEILAKKIASTGAQLDAGKDLKGDKLQGKALEKIEKEFNEAKDKLEEKLNDIADLEKKYKELEESNVILKSEIKFDQGKLEEYNKYTNPPAEPAAAEPAAEEGDNNPVVTVEKGTIDGKEVTKETRKDGTEIVYMENEKIITYSDGRSVKIKN